MVGTRILISFVWICFACCGPRLRQSGALVHSKKLHSLIQHHFRSNNAHEKLFISDIVGIIFIFIGSGFFLICAKAGDEDQYSAVELHDIYLRPASLVYTSMSILIVVGSLLTDRHIKNKIKSYYSNAMNAENEQSEL